MEVVVEKSTVIERVREELRHKQDLMIPDLVDTHLETCNKYIRLVQGRNAGNYFNKLQWHFKGLSYGMYAGYQTPLNVAMHMHYENWLAISQKFAEIDQSTRELLPGKAFGAAQIVIIALCFKLRTIFSRVPDTLMDIMRNARVLHHRLDSWGDVLTDLFTESSPIVSPVAVDFQTTMMRATKVIVDYVSVHLEYTLDELTTGLSELGQLKMFNCVSSGKLQVPMGLTLQAQLMVRAANSYGVAGVDAAEEFCHIRSSHPTRVSHGAANPYFQMLGAPESLSTDPLQALVHFTATYLNTDGARVGPIGLVLDIPIWIHIFGNSQDNINEVGTLWLKNVFG